MGDEREVAAAAQRLGELLREHLPYRRQWETVGGARLNPGREINQAMVAGVLAEHLRDIGEVEDDQIDLPRRLKDVVSRALTGRVLSHRTLGWFVEAFGMSDLHRGQLWALRSGGEPSRLVVVPPLHTIAEGEISTMRYQTISLHEFHQVGPDGLPTQHRTVHMIRALEPLQTYSYRFDTDTAVVEVLRGGTAGPVLRTSEPGIFAVEISLNRPLATGETASFEYRTLLNYRTPPPREFRRACRRPVSNVEMNVQFDPARLPRQVRWATWTSLNDRAPTIDAPMPLEPDGSVHRYIDSFEGIAGFVWDFPPA